MIISGEVIEEIPVRFNGCRCYEEKWGRITSAANWLRYRYRASIILIDNWEIIAVSESAMSQVDKSKHEKGSIPNDNKIFH